MDSEQLRREFEAWAVKRLGCLLDRDVDGYADSDTTAAYLAAIHFHNAAVEAAAKVCRDGLTDEFCRGEWGKPHMALSRAEGKIRALKAGE